MALSSLTCPAPIRHATRPPRADPEVLDAAVELFSQKRFEEALHKTFAYLFPRRSIPDVAREALTFPQGSSRVTVRLVDGELSIRVPLVRLSPSSNSTAALRFLLTKESGTGQLYQPRLRGDEVSFEFSDRLHRLHPHKIVEVLRRMPVEADDHDDWMVGEFGVELLDREPIRPLAPPELDRAEGIWQTHFREVQELLKEAQRRRSLFFLNEVTCYAIHHVRCSVPLGGLLAAKLAESAVVFNDTNLEPMKREAALGRFAKEMLAASREVLAQSLGFAELSISPLAEGSRSVLDKYLGAGDYPANVAGVRSSGRYMEAAVALLSTYSFLLARYAWPEKVENELLEGLTRSSGRPWREVSRDLTDRGVALVDGWDEPAEAGDEAPTLEGAVREPAGERVQA